jgi:hypothetical protein
LFGALTERNNPRDDFGGLTGALGFGFMSFVESRLGLRRRSATLCSQFTSVGGDGLDFGMMGAARVVDAACF